MRLLETRRNVPVPSLVFARDIYPREADVSRVHVAALKEAVKGGHQLPPIEAEAATMRIVDGWHRATAYNELDMPVPEVRLCEYVGEAELIARAVELNAAHGMALNQRDRRRAALMLRDAGLGGREIAVVLHVTEPKVENLLVSVAYAAPGVDIVAGTGRAIPLKRPQIAAVRGRTVGQNEYEALRRAASTPYALLAVQLADALRWGWITITPAVRERLTELRDLIDAALRNGAAG